jgi:hypothetical protein
VCVCACVRVCVCVCVCVCVTYTRYRVSDAALLVAQSFNAISMGVGAASANSELVAGCLVRVPVLLCIAKIISFM